MWREITLAQRQLDSHYLLWWIGLSRAQRQLTRQLQSSSVARGPSMNNGIYLSDVHAFKRLD